MKNEIGTIPEVAQPRRGPKGPDAPKSIRYISARIRDSRLRELLDQALSARPEVSTNTWVLEAIREKLVRELSEQHQQA